jgi:enamine deaminase RidA (YjgF/YER057c/UK114 family)
MEQMEVPDDLAPMLRAFTLEVLRSQVNAFRMACFDHSCLVRGAGSSVSCVCAAEGALTRASPTFPFLTAPTHRRQQPNDLNAFGAEYFKDLAEKQAATAAAAAEEAVDAAT